MSIFETLAAFSYIPEVSFFFSCSKILLCPTLVTIKASLSIRGTIPVIAWAD